MKPWQSILLGIFLGLIFSAGILLISSPPRGEPITLLPTPTPAPITVFVTGAVHQPGLYTLPNPSRAQEAILAAGGYLLEADQSAVNLAAFLRDGEKILIPFIPTPLPEKAEEIPTPALPTPSVEKPLNINTATAEELDLLPGIGPSKASAIIAYRNKHGDFKRIEDLLNVSGIGPSIFDQIKDRITVVPTP